MEITIKPYESKYRDGVVDILQYLWEFQEKERYERFDWLYESNSNPSFDETLAVIAVNEEDDVLGFRGWVPGIIWQEGKQYVVARAADVVVSPKGRRQGIFSKMTTFSLSYLKEKGVSGILNLSSNSQSNPGYIKLGWIPLVQLNIWYKLNVGRKFPMHEKEYEYYGSKIGLYPYIPKGLTTPSNSNDSLCFSMEEGQLDWYADRPNKKYQTVVTYDKSGQLTSLFITEKRNEVAGLIYFYCTDDIIGGYAFKQLCKRIENNVVAVWGWALRKEQKSLLHRLGFFSIPFYEKLKKKPPILVRSVDDTAEENHWCLGKKDLRETKNWNVNLIDDF